MQMQTNYFINYIVINKELYQHILELYLTNMNLYRQ